MNEIIRYLLSVQDTVYRDFHSKLMPGVPKDRIIGVRTPVLRKYAKELHGTDVAKAFIYELPHFYYEENNLHAFLLEKISDFDECTQMLEEFFPYIDNWATCDMTCPKVFSKNPDKLLQKCRYWMTLPHIYATRFSIVMLLKFFSKENFSDEILDLAMSSGTDDYYIKMAQAWLLAECSVMHFDSVFEFIKTEVKDEFVVRAAIRKACDSYRITNDKKMLLKQLLI